MAALTIRKLDESVKRRLKVRAAHNGCSMEEEARRILESAVRDEDEPDNLADLALEIFGPDKGVDLDPVLRKLRFGMGKLPDFET